MYLGAALGYVFYIGPLMGRDPYKWEAASVQVSANTTPGSYYIGVLVDWDKTIPEANELNNDVSTPITVQP